MLSAGEKHNPDRKKATAGSLLTATACTTTHAHTRPSSRRPGSSTFARHVERQPLRPHRVEGHPAPGDRVERVMLESDVGTTPRHAADVLEGKPLTPRRSDREKNSIQNPTPISHTRWEQFPAMPPLVERGSLQPAVPPLSEMGTVEETPHASVMAEVAADSSHVHHGSSEAVQEEEVETTQVFVSTQLSATQVYVASASDSTVGDAKVSTALDVSQTEEDGPRKRLRLKAVQDSDSDEDQNTEESNAPQAPIPKEPEEEWKVLVRGMSPKDLFCVLGPGATPSLCMLPSETAMAATVPVLKRLIRPQLRPNASRCRQYKKSGIPLSSH